MDDFGIGGRITDDKSAQFNFGEVPLYTGDDSQRNLSVENYLIHG